MVRRRSALAAFALAAGCGDDPQVFVDAAITADADVTDAPVDAPTDAPAAVCGNGVIEPGETCDPVGSCPTACPDTLACTTDMRVGDPALCTAACLHDAVACVTGDGCCAPGCDNTTDGECPWIVGPDFADTYDVRDLGLPAGLPANYGGLVIAPDDPMTLLIGGAANQAVGKIYRMGLQRDPDGHIVGLVGPAVEVRDGAYIDGGLAFTDDGVLVLSRYPVNAIGFQKAGSTTTDKIVSLGAAPLSIAQSIGGLAQVPTAHPGAGRWKVVSWPGGQWYDVTLTPDGAGTYDVTAATMVVVTAGGPEGIAYVPLGSPEFAAPSLLISEYSAGKVGAYAVDVAGDPVLASRRDFLSRLPNAEDATIDPVSGDFLFSTYGGGNRVVVVRGFASVIDRTLPRR